METKYINTLYVMLNKKQAEVFINVSKSFGSIFYSNENKTAPIFVNGEKTITTVGVNLVGVYHGNDKSTNIYVDNRIWKYLLEEFNELFPSKDI